MCRRQGSFRERICEVLLSSHMSYPSTFWAYFSSISSTNVWVQFFALKCILFINIHYCHVNATSITVGYICIVHAREEIKVLLQHPWFSAFCAIRALEACAFVTLSIHFHESIDNPNTICCPCGNLVMKWSLFLNVNKCCCIWRPIFCTTSCCGNLAWSCIWRPIFALLHVVVI